MASRNGSGKGGAAASLGKHEGLSDNGAPQAQKLRCSCAPEHLRLRSEHGELVQPRGKAVNRCEYCAKLAAMENCEMLVADALEGTAPTIIMILGTRTPTLSMWSFQRGIDHVIKAVRRRWPDAQYARQVEYTTGYGPRAGGKRRPHWNWFWKGIPEGDIEELRALVLRIWCGHVDALPALQYVERIDNAVGLTKYVTQHFMKMSQAPPAGFTGQRFNTSQQYFGTLTRAQARARAREALALKRELHKQAARTDPDRPTTAHDVELNAQIAYRVAIATRWVLASASGARLSDQALPRTTVRERATSYASERARKRAEALRPAWLPERTTLC